MNTKAWIVLCVIVLLAGCQESYNAEFSVPLTALMPQSGTEQRSIDPLDVQVSVEKIAADAGLKPYIENTQQDDLFGLSEDIIDAPAANTRTWKHPQHPLFLSMTRHTGEFVLLLNCAAQDKADPEAQALYRQLEKQLSQLPVKLTAAEAVK